MSASDPLQALHGLLIVATVFAWFHLGWKPYAIAKGEQDLFGLRCAWWNLVASRPEWRQNAACKAFTRLLEDLSASLPRYTLGLLVTLWLSGVRPSGSVVSDVIASIPDPQLREPARGILDAALRAVWMTMLRQSVVVLPVAVLLLPVVLIAALAVSVIRQGAAGLVSVPAVIACGMRRFTSAALPCVLAVGLDASKPPRPA